MKSKILAKLDIDNNKVMHDLSLVEKSGFDSVYKEYAFGIWHTKMLWNNTGSDESRLSQEYAGHAQKNSIGKQTRYLNSLIESNFKLAQLKSVRIFRSQNGGLILPHIDYLEFKSGFKRIHLVLSSDATCLNSENNTVYNMQPGELWFLDGREVHSALSASWSGKACLVLDFSNDANLEEIFCEGNQFSFRNLVPKIVNDRTKWSDDAHQAFIQLAATANMQTIKGMIGLACNFHFYHRLSCIEMFQLTDEAFLQHSCEEVRGYYKSLRSLLIEKGYLPSILRELQA